MTRATLQALGDGRFRLTGDLDYETVQPLLEDDDILFSGEPQRIEIDLAGVGRSTSVGLALMLEWLRQSQARNVAIRFNNVPAQMLGMAKVSQLETILQLQN